MLFIYLDLRPYYLGMLMTGEKFAYVYLDMHLLPSNIYTE